MAKTVVQPKEWSEIIDITPVMAQKILNDSQFSHNRKVSPRNVSYYADQIKRGLFATSELRMMHLDGKTILTNGQHRLLAVIEAGLPITVTIYHKSVISADDVARDYRHADAHLKRTLTAQLSASGMVEVSGLTESRFNKLSYAVGPIIGEFVASSFSGYQHMVRSADMRLHAIEFFLPAYRQFSDAVAGCEVKMNRACNTMSPMSIALVTMHFQPEKAFTFWHRVAMNDGLIKGDPCRTLALFLLTTPARGNTYNWLCRSVAVAWNAYIRARPLHIIRVSDTTSPILIACTPYGGNHHLPVDFSLATPYETAQAILEKARKEATRD